MVFAQLCAQRVMLEGMILKPNMVQFRDRPAAGRKSVNEVSDVTVKCLLPDRSRGRSGDCVPSRRPVLRIPCSARLNAMNVRFKSRLPWAVAFSYARAIQQPALEIWRREEVNVSAAQRVSSSPNRLAIARPRRGEYTAAMENARTITTLDAARSKPAAQQKTERTAMTEPKAKPEANLDAMPKAETKAAPKPGSAADAKDDLQTLPRGGGREKIGFVAGRPDPSRGEKRLTQYGPNEIAEKRTNVILKFLSYFWGPIPWMIEAAVILSAAARHWPDFGIILVLLLANAVVGFWEEHQAGNAIAALKASLRSRPG